MSERLCERSHARLRARCAGSADARRPAAPEVRRPVAPEVRLRARIAARLCDTRGFMLAEQLVSILFLGLLGIMVTAGIGAALSAYGNITRQATAESLLARAVESVSDEMAYAADVDEGDPAENPAFLSGNLHDTVQFDESDDSRGIWLHASGQAVNLVPAQSGLVARLDDVLYYETKSETRKVPARTWTFRVSVVPTDDLSAAPLAETTMMVTRIGS